MRKLKRSIARTNMLNTGYSQLNKKQSDEKSFFSKNWRGWV